MLLTILRCKLNFLIKQYEKQYLSRYKQPKSGVKKSSNLKHDADTGILTLGKYVNAKRRAKQDEIREYDLFKFKKYVRNKAFASCRSQLLNLKNNHKKVKHIKYDNYKIN